MRDTFVHIKETHAICCIVQRMRVHGCFISLKTLTITYFCTPELYSGFFIYNLYVMCLREIIIVASLCELVTKFLLNSVCIYIYMFWQL